MSDFMDRLDTVAGDPLRNLELSQAGQEAREEQRASDVKDVLQMYKVKKFAEVTGNDDIVENLQGLQQMARWVMNDNKYFEIFPCVLVVTDLFWIAAEIDYGQDAESLFLTVSVIYFCGFAFELLIRILANPGHICTDYFLLFDITIVGISAVDLLVSLGSLQDFLPFDLSFFTALRIIRLARICHLAKYVKNLALLRILVEAIIESLQPLAIVGVLTAITVISFAIMMTTLVPAASEDGPAIQAAALHYYRSVARSSLTLLEGMSGASDWGTAIAFDLFQAAQHGKLGSLSMLLCMMLAYVALRLGLNGLVTAVFLERLFRASDKEAETAANQELAEQGELLKELDKMFGASEGHASLERITWPQVEEKLAAYPQVQKVLPFAMADIQQLFDHVDEDQDGSIETDEFIFAIFRLRAMTKSVDMLSIDYQQEKALQRVAELHHGLRYAIAGIQSRLTSLLAILPGLTDEIEAVEKGMEEVKQKEQELQSKRELRRRLRCEPAKSLHVVEKMPQLSVEDLRGTLQLNKRLAEVEALVEGLQKGGASNHVADVDADDQMGAVADCIVQSLQLALQQELAVVRVMAAEERAAAAKYQAPRRTSRLAGSMSSSTRGGRGPVAGGSVAGMDGKSFATAS